MVIGLAGEVPALILPPMRMMLSSSTPRIECFMSELRLFDNTRISDHEVCNRKYYFRHLRNWVVEGPRIKADFGTCWHSAMDVLWQHAAATSTMGDLQELYAAAYKAAELKWNELGLPDDHKTHNLDTLAEMLFKYTMKRLPQIKKDFEILSIEQPFVVPLYHDRPTFYCGRIDKKVRSKQHGGIWPIDHKITGWYRGSGDQVNFRQEWLDGFSPNSQMEGYAFATWLEHGDEFQGIMVDAALVHRTHPKFEFIPVKRGSAHLDAWLWETRSKITSILNNEHDLEMYEESISQYGNEGGTSFLPAFRKNPAACSMYEGCEFLDLCKSWGNPHLQAVPEHLGFIEKAWTPFTPEQQARIEELARSVEKSK